MAIDEDEMNPAIRDDPDQEEAEEVDRLEELEAVESRRYKSCLQKDPFFRNTKEVPEYEALLEVANIFSDAHSYILQRMLAQPCITLKKFYITFINRAATKQLSFHPSYVKYLKADAHELKILAVSVIKTINEAIHDIDVGDENVQRGDDKSSKEKEESKKKRRISKSMRAGSDEDHEDEGEIGRSIGYRLVLTTDEMSGTELVVLISELQNSELLKGDCELKPVELNLWWVILDEMVHNNGRAEINWILRNARSVNSSFTQLHAEQVVHRLVDNCWIKKCEGDVVISQRTVTELEPLLRGRYDIPACTVCNQLIVQLHYAAECTKCSSKMHGHCWKKICSINKDEHVGCPKFGCNEELNKKGVDMEIKRNVDEEEFREPVHTVPEKLFKLKGEKTSPQKKAGIVGGDAEEDGNEEEAAPAGNRAKPVKRGSKQRRLVVLAEEDEASNEPAELAPSTSKPKKQSKSKPKRSRIASSSDEEIQDKSDGASESDFEVANKVPLKKSRAGRRGTTSFHNKRKTPETDDDQVYIDSSD